VHRLRNHLQLSDPGQSQCQLIVVSGVNDGSGATTTSLSLARSFADSRQKTVVVDADLVSEGITEELGFAQTEGVREALVHDRLNGEVKSTVEEHLFAVPSGFDMAINDQCVSKQSLAALFGRLREQFDVVIVDVGSCEQRLLAGVAAALADDVLLVVPANVPAQVATGAFRRMKTNVQPVQLVFNGALHSDPSLPVES
jgi:Mrp family chromosome partitioning ATPase